MDRFQLTEIAGGHLLSVPGLRGAGIASGVQQDGALDLAVVTADEPRCAAGVFTRSELPAAPVCLSRSRLAASPRVRSIVINAGNANALTGAGGAADALAMAERTERRFGAPALVLSTGVIGVPMPIDRVLDGIDRAAEVCDADAGLDIARAMMTTDTRPKTLAVTVSSPDSSGSPAESWTVGGVAKGSGMIHPDMGTMLAVVATDAEMTPRALDLVLRRAVDRSFHEISVDGDTSTNDAVLVLAGGASHPAIDIHSPHLAAVEAAMTHVCRRLARDIVFDGEGATRVMELRVSGARTDEEAQQVARVIACSPLVKTALAGGDPNWGRILAAAARAGVPLDEKRLQLWLGTQQVFDGQPLAADEATLDQEFSAPEVTVHLRLGDHPGQARMLTTDLTKRYVEINADYRT